MAERPHDHTRVVVMTTLAWIAAHAVLLGVVSVPGYLECRSAPQSAGQFGGCGVGIGIVALVIGWLQPIYGVPALIIAFRRKHTALAQGFVIGVCAVTLLFTALCFGSVFTLG